MIVVWLPKAIANRDALIDYIAQENRKAAIEQDSLLEAQINQLLAFSEIGRAGRVIGTRELVIGHTSFIVIYRIRTEAKRIEILRVLYTSQLWP